MSANDDYVGHQINCPSCRAAITVPPNPEAGPAEPAQSSIAIATPPGMPPPPAPPKAVRLSVSALSTPQAHAPAPDPDRLGSAAYQALQTHKPKKNYSGVIASVAAVLVIGALAYWGYMQRDWVKAKWKSIRGPTEQEKAAAAAAAAEAAKPPPPPELTAAEIMQKVAQVYKGLPSFTSTGKSTFLDLSAISPAQPAATPKITSCDITLKMSKPLNFRIDMVTPAATITGWSTNGNGDFVQANNRRSRLASDEELFSRFTSGSSIGITVGVGEIVRLFEEGAKPDLDNPAIEWARGPDATLNGQMCYVLAGTVKLQPVMLWVNRSTFLIPQTQVALTAAMTNAAKLDDAQLKMALKDWQMGLVKLYRLDDAQIKEELKAENNGKDPTLVQIANVKKWLKITASVTDTYDSIQTNANFAAADFQPNAPAPSNMSPGAPQPGGGGGGAPGAGGGRASRIANGANRRGN
jgi:hypothetical protein